MGPRRSPRVRGAGFGGGGEGAEAEVLARVVQERGVRPEALLSSAAGEGRCAALAALSDSLDFVAGSVRHFGERRRHDPSPQVPHSPPLPPPPLSFGRCYHQEGPQPLPEKTAFASFCSQGPN